MTPNYDDHVLTSVPSTVLSLVGITCIILGALVVTFDYPQIEYLGGFDNPIIETNDPSMDRGLYERLIVEFAIGVVILCAGVALCMPKVIMIIVESLGRRRQI